MGRRSSGGARRIDNRGDASNLRYVGTSIPDTLNHGAMTALEWMAVALTLLLLALLAAAWLVRWQRRRRWPAPRRSGWLTDRMVNQIIETGSLSGRQVPEADLDLEEIAREEERFWSESWDEPGPYWE